VQQTIYPNRKRRIIAADLIQNAQTMLHNQHEVESQKLQELRKVCVIFQIPGPQPPCNPNAGLEFSVEITGGNNPQPSTFILTPDSSQLVTLGPGSFTIVESAVFGIRSVTFSGDCMQTAPGSMEATGIISAGQHLTCTITNTITND
jgi:hypothetical protein